MSLNNPLLTLGDKVETEAGNTCSLMKNKSNIYLRNDSSQSGTFRLKITGSTMETLTFNDKFGRGKVGWGGRREWEGKGRVHLDGTNHKSRIIIPSQST